MFVHTNEVYDVKSEIRERGDRLQKKAGSTQRSGFHISGFFGPGISAD